MIAYPHKQQTQHTSQAYAKYGRSDGADRFPGGSDPKAFDAFREYVFRTKRPEHSQNHYSDERDSHQHPQERSQGHCQPNRPDTREPDSHQDNHRAPPPPKEFYTEPRKPQAHYKNPPPSSQPRPFSKGVSRAQRPLLTGKVSACDDGRASCGACGDDLCTGEVAVVTPCSHFFHRDCFAKLMTSAESVNCPTCNEHFTNRC